MLAEPVSDALKHEHLRGLEVDKDEMIVQEDSRLAEARPWPEVVLKVFRYS